MRKLAKNNPSFMSQFCKVSKTTKNLVKIRGEKNEKNGWKLHFIPNIWDFVPVFSQF